MRIDLPCPRSPGELVLCAVSGGRDSMVLLHLLHALSGERGFRLAAAHFNHRLRPTADRDEDFVRGWCLERHIPLETGSGDVRAFSREAGTSLEDAARQLRYRFLEEAAEDLGVTYRHLLYVLADFRKRGILEKTPQGYRVRDMEALEELRIIG